MKRVYLKETWCDNRLSVKKSKIDNLGIFTSSAINKGEKIMEWGGYVVKKNNFNEHTYRIQSAVPINDNHYLAEKIEGDSKDISNIDEYLNHSCDPNVWLIDEVTLVSKRYIRKNDEITLDCATWDADTDWPYTHNGKCKCRKNKCRKVISANDWKLKDVQKEYEGHFSPYIQYKIDQLNNSDNNMVKNTD